LSADFDGNFDEGAQQQTLSKRLLSFIHFVLLEAAENASYGRLSKRWES
jgi:hypothetical protein